MKAGILAVIALGSALIMPAKAQVPGVINYQGRVAVGGTNFNGTGLFKFALVNGGTNLVSQATATATISGGFLTIVTVTYGGSGYASAPTVTVVGGGGSNAVLTALVGGGAVTNVVVNNPGSGYSSIPTIVIAPPPPGIVYVSYWSNDGSSVGGGQPTGNVSLPVTKGLYSVLLGDMTISNMTAAVPAAVFTNSDVLLRVWFNDGVTGFQQLSPDQRIASVGYAMMAANVPNGAITSNQLAAGAVGSTQIAAGAVGATQIAAGAVGNSQLAAGAITAANIVTGAISNAQLAIPYLSGTTNTASLVFTDFVQNYNITVPFSAPFNTPPIVTATIAARTQNDGVFYAPQIAATTTSNSTINLPTDYQQVNAAISNANYISALSVNGNPAIAYVTSSGAQFERALDSQGATWGAPVTVSTVATNAYLQNYITALLANGNPAVVFSTITQTTNTSVVTLAYFRAADANGATWGTNVTIAVISNGSVNGNLGVAVDGSGIVNGNPAVVYTTSISYFGTNSVEFFTNVLSFVRATDANGSGWGTPVQVQVNTTNNYYNSVSGPVFIGGNPAVCYTVSGVAGVGLYYESALNANGTSWGSPVTVDTNADQPVLFPANGKPAIAYIGAKGIEIEYVQATTTNGLSWPSPLVLAQYPLDVTAGLFGTTPVIWYTQNGQNSVQYLRAANADGTAWNAPVTVNIPFFVGELVQGGTGIVYQTGYSGNYLFSHPNLLDRPTVNWIAVHP